jgi:hypothetical protein
MDKRKEEKQNVNKMYRVLTTVVDRHEKKEERE